MFLKLCSATLMASVRSARPSGSLESLLGQGRKGSESKKEEEDSIKKMKIVFEEATKDVFGKHSRGKIARPIAISFLLDGHSATTVAIASGFNKRTVTACFETSVKQKLSKWQKELKNAMTPTERQRLIAEKKRELSF